MSDAIIKLKDFRRRQPFVPFRIELRDGRALAIDRRFQYAFNEDRVVVLDDRDRIESFRPTDIVDVRALPAFS